MNKKSIWAVVAGVLFIIIITTLVDLVLHAIGVGEDDTNKAR